MGYINPLLRLPAGRALLDLPAEDRQRIEAVMRDLRDQANAEAETAWRRRKGPMAAYWRAVATYARHVAHCLRHGTEVNDQAPRPPVVPLQISLDCDHPRDDDSKFPVLGYREE